MGILVLFIYVTRLAPNEIFRLNPKTFFSIITVMIITVTFLIAVRNKNVDFGVDNEQFVKNNILFSKVTFITVIII